MTQLTADGAQVFTPYTVAKVDPLVDQAITHLEGKIKQLMSLTGAGPEIAIAPQLISPQLLFNVPTIRSFGAPRNTTELRPLQALMAALGSIQPALTGRPPISGRYENESS